MLIGYMREQYPDFLNNPPQLTDLEAFYKAAKKRFDEDPEFKKRSQLNVVQLQAGDPDSLKVWSSICDISRQYFMQIYKRLGITNNEYGESFYNNMIPGVIKELEDKGLIKVDDGAKCIFVEGFPEPVIAVKSDGGYNYDSTDLAAVRYRLLDLKADRSIYITDSGQEGHFFKIFKVAQLAGWFDPKKQRLDHMGFGVVLGDDGKKFKTRSGEAVKLLVLLDEAKERALNVLKGRLEAGEGKEGKETQEQKSNLAPEEIDQAAEKIGTAAIKYFDLKQNRISTYKFSFDNMLDQKGNTPVYLMYAYARVCSLLRKSGLSGDDLKKLAKENGFKITHPHERVLAIALLRFPEILEAVVDDLAINKLCDLIYDVCVRLSEGYAKYRILDDPNKNSRILLIEATRLVLQKSFYMVGIDPLEKI